MQLIHKQSFVPRFWKYLVSFKRVLFTSETFGRTQGAKLQATTWEELLKIMLGIVDSLLKGGRGNLDQASPLGTKLCPQLLKVCAGYIEVVIFRFCSNCGFVQEQKAPFFGSIWLIYYKDGNRELQPSLIGIAYAWDSPIV